MPTIKQPLGVFCGPSLPAADRLPVAGITYLPPATRGDVERAVEEFDALLMIDGVFHHDLAPSPKEVYAACKTVRMFGSASMGALRAAECWPFGMTPLGVIAGWYVRELIDGDDEVAVLVRPESQESITVPLVNVRFVAWIARRAGLFDLAVAERWIREARQIFYMERGWHGVLALLDAPLRDAIGRIATEYGDLKRNDARFSLRAVARRLRL